MLQRIASLCLLLSISVFAPLFLFLLSLVSHTVELTCPDLFSSLLLPVFPVLCMEFLACFTLDHLLKWPCWLIGCLILAPPGFTSYGCSLYPGQYGLRAYLLIPDQECHELLGLICTDMLVCFSGQKYSLLQAYPLLTQTSVPAVLSFKKFDGILKKLWNFIFWTSIYYTPPVPVTYMLDPILPINTSFLPLKVFTIQLDFFHIPHCLLI